MRWVTKEIEDPDEYNHPHLRDLRASEAEASHGIETLTNFDNVRDRKQF